MACKTYMAAIGQAPMSVQMLEEPNTPARYFSSSGVYLLTKSTQTDASGPASLQSWGVSLKNCTLCAFECKKCMYIVGFSQTHKHKEQSSQATHGIQDVLHALHGGGVDQQAVQLVDEAGADITRDGVRVGGVGGDAEHGDAPNRLGTRAKAEEIADLKGISIGQ